MIEFEKFVLDNGLRVLVHEDKSTALVAVNVLYNVGSKDESPDKTGFAHLFEHLMFSGSKNAPDFDEPIQEAGGENNAYTNADVTNFYESLPAENIETAFWLESDRMQFLNINQKSLDTQKKVVIEEFKETSLNAPYGDVWHHLGEMAYKKHPYRWPTIGKEISHIEEATLEEVKAFYEKHYCPNNAILVVAGNTTVAEVKQLSEKWFGDIPRVEMAPKKTIVEPQQTVFQQKNHLAKVPADAFYMAFHAPARIDKDYPVSDLVSDILCNGSSSRFYRKLYKEQRLFNSIDAFITGYLEPGLMVIEGRPSDGVSLEEAEAAIWKELELLKQEGVEEHELTKCQNKIESMLVFSECNVLNKAINLAFFELIDRPEWINQEKEIYQNVSLADVKRVANDIFRKENCSILYYRSDEK